MPQYLLRLPEDDALYVTLMKPKAMAILFDDINVFCVYSICGIGHIEILLPFITTVWTRVVLAIIRLTLLWPR